MIHDVPGVFVDEDYEVEEPARYLDVHDVRLPPFVGSLCTFGTGRCPCDAVPWRYEIMFLQDLVHRGRGEICKIPVDECIGNLPERHPRMPALEAGADPSLPKGLLEVGLAHPCHGKVVLLTKRKNDVLRFSDSVCLNQARYLPPSWKERRILCRVVFHQEPEVKRHSLPDHYDVS